LCAGPAKRRSIRVCLDFFVTFCIKAKSKYSFFQEKESDNNAIEAAN